jgi:hypothetical protein
MAHRHRLSRKRTIAGSGIYLGLVAPPSSSRSVSPSPPSAEVPYIAVDPTTTGEY